MSYPNSDSASAKLYQRALNSLPGGNTRTTVFMKPYPLYASKGEGCHVWDVDGDIRIDCVNNFTSNIHGYANPEINRVVQEQLARGTAFGMPTVAEIELAELICSRVCSIERVRFTNSGTEAVMMAIKAARAFTKRPKIAKVEGSYHGSYDYAEVSLDSSPGNWGEMTAPTSVPYAEGTPEAVLADVITIPFNDPERSLQILSQHASELAGILVDPLPNRAGLIPASQAFIQGLADFCEKNGSLLIFDEVISFRLGYHGAQAIWNVQPHLTALGKIIGGGFPIGAVGGKEEVMAVFDPRCGKPALPHGGTFSANPISMCAGIAALKQLTPAVYDHLAEMGEALRLAINHAFAARHLPGRAVGMGSLIKVHFSESDVTDYRSGYQSPEVARRLSIFVKGVLNRGVVAASYGLLVLSTPMTLSEIDSIASAVERALDDVVLSLNSQPGT